jgi:hypothetical protein
MDLGLHNEGHAASRVDLFSPEAGERYQMRGAIAKPALPHIYQLFVLCSDLVKHHNAFHLISSFYEHEFNLLNQVHQELYLRFQ